MSGLLRQTAVAALNDLRAVGRRLRAILGQPTDFMELGLALVAIGWGGLLLNPAQNVFSTSPASWELIARYLSELEFAAVVIVVGVVKLVAVLIEVRPLRVAASFLGACMWGSIDASLLVSGTAPPGIATFTFYAGVSIWVLYRQVRRVDVTRLLLLIRRIRPQAFV